MGYSTDIYLPHTHILTATTTTVCSRSGRLKRIMINGGTLTGAITLYDALTAVAGEQIAIIDANQVPAEDYVYDCTFDVGLTIVTAANVDITVVADKGAG